MSSEALISARSLSKRYVMYDRPQDRLKQGLFGRRRQYYREFWALKNVSFDIFPGESVGIIGRNGSGKSTLLQLIAGTLAPTSGTLEVNGAVAALLELGSGFNPEFTGRENVFMNGAILGLNRREVEALLPDIIAFADIGDFVDQPVKTYSSGMAIRLAFAVQAFVPKDILIVDEALAVGDELFQRKCFARIDEFKSQGGTILFVSHASAAILQLCERAVLLHAGELVFSGPSTYVVNLYRKFLYAPVGRQEALLEEMKESLGEVPRGMCDEHAREVGERAGDSPPLLHHLENENQDGVHRLQPMYDPSLESLSTVHYESRGARIVATKILTPEGEPVNVLVPRGRYVWRYRVEFDQDCYNVRFGMLIKTLAGIEIGGGVTARAYAGVPHIAAGTVLTVDFAFLANLTNGTYFLNAGVLGVIDDTEVYLDRKVDLAAFKILSDDVTLMTAIVDFHILPHISRYHEEPV
ncbi:MAG: ABC transporter ATP-binding protein [Candidatus Binatia bacterium]